jgi:hypothetical protein
VLLHHGGTEVCHSSFFGIPLNAKLMIDVLDGSRTVHQDGTMRCTGAQRPRRCNLHE